MVRDVIGHGLNRLRRGLFLRLRWLKFLRRQRHAGIWLPQLGRLLRRRIGGQRLITGEQLCIAIRERIQGCQVELCPVRQRVLTAREPAADFNQLALSLRGSIARVADNSAPFQALKGHTE